MDVVEASFDLYKDKAVSTINAINNLYTFVFVSVATVFFPIVYTLPQKVAVMEQIFVTFFAALFFVFYLIYAYLTAKYREYKNKYSIILVKCVVGQYYKELQEPTYKKMCSKIAELTQLNEKEVMNILIKEYPPKENLIIS